ncbi:MAG: DsbA family protein [Alphaproteobacteria bacterium]
MSTQTTTDMLEARPDQTRRRALAILMSGAAFAALAGCDSADSPQSTIQAGDDASRARFEALMQPSSMEEMIIGEVNAPVTIIEYASMTCPHCAAFHTGTYPELKEKYIETGKARLIFREYPIGNLAVAAAMLARCVDRQKFFPFIDALFQKQQVWVTDNPVAPLKEMAKQVGISEENFDKCLSNQTILSGIREVATRANKEFEVNSTPTFFVNGEILLGRRPLADFEKIMAPYL